MTKYLVWITINPLLLSFLLLVIIIIIQLLLILSYFLYTFCRLVYHNMADSSQSRSSTHDPLERSPTEISLEVTLSILICLTSILGNLLVVYVVNKDSRLKGVTNIFIHNLALTDISMASLHMPFWVTSLYTGTWIFSEKGCEFQAAIQFTLGIASILNMGLISFNRYFRVVKPALYSKIFASKRMARVYCALVWVASLLLATPPLYGWGKMAYHPYFAVCTFTWEIQYISYAILVVGGVVNGTTLAIFYSYYKIYKTLKESTRNLNAHGIDGAVSAGRHRTDIRLLKTSFTVVCVFVMTWGPVSVIVIVESVGCFIPRGIFSAVIFLMFTSSLANPIVYGIMNPQFQAAFKRALSLGRYGNGQISQSHTRHETNVSISWCEMRAYDQISF